MAKSPKKNPQQKQGQETNPSPQKIIPPRGFDLSGISPSKLVITRELGVMREVKKPPVVAVTATGLQISPLQVREFVVDETPAEYRGAVVGFYNGEEVAGQVEVSYDRAEVYCEIPTYPNYVQMNEAVFYLARLLGGCVSGELMVAVVRRQLAERGLDLAGQTLLGQLIDLVQESHFDVERARRESALPVVMGMARAAWVYIQGVRQDAVELPDPLAGVKMERYILSKKILHILEQRCPLRDDDLVKQRQMFENDFGRKRARQQTVLGLKPLEPGELSMETRLGLTLETAQIASAKRKAWFWMMMERASWKSEREERVRTRLFDYGAEVPHDPSEYSLRDTEERIVQMVDVIASRVAALERGERVTDTRLIELFLWARALDSERAKYPFGVQAATRSLQQARVFGLDANAKMYKALGERAGLQVSSKVREQICDACLDERSYEAREALEYLVAATRSVYFEPFDSE